MALNRIVGGATLASLLLVVAFLAGCATPPTDPEDRKEFDATNDPLEPTNRFFFGFNETLDHGFIRPVAIAYRDVVPEFGRQRVHDVVTNLREPWIFVNDVLQADANRAGATFSRFIINSTLGVLGLFDVADSNTFNLPYHDNDAGLTFARWGVSDGPYLVLPLLGPSNPRDATGIVAEYFLDPVSLYFDHHNLDAVNWGRTGAEALDTRTNYLDTLDSLERTSLDFYSTLRSISRQHRQDEINHRDVPVGTAPVKQGESGGAPARQAAANGKQ